MRPLLLLPAILGAAASPLAAQPDPEFRPVLVAVEVTPQQVRPGGSFTVTYRFRNDGTAAAADDYMVFAHYEFPEPSCEHIALHQDHSPEIGTSTWGPGQTIDDGPMTVSVPPQAAEGDYAIHVGVYAPQLGGARLLDQYAGIVTVSADAPLPSTELNPLPRSELARRRAALGSGFENPAVLETTAWRFELSRQTGAYRLIDKTTGEAWHSDVTSPHFCRYTGTDGTRRRAYTVDRLDRIEVGPRHILFSHTPRDGGRIAGPAIRFRVEVGQDARELVISYDQFAQEITEVRLLDNAFPVTDADKGYIVVPSRTGIVVSADSGHAFQSRFRTYDHGGCQMAMFGAVKNGSGLLWAWDSPYVTASARSLVPAPEPAPGAQVILSSLQLRGDARRVTLRVVSSGGYVGIAHAYRAIAERRGLARTWLEKAQWAPEVWKLAGAPDFKPFVMMRTLKSSVYHRSEADEHVDVGYTFDEVARCAEHWKNDLKLDKALVVLAGWIHRGYDNQHPDILPAAPECGGDEALADCSRRVQALGYLCGGHDNYQDMYRDAPSWDESYIMRNPDGSIRQGGNWAGGPCWLICSKKGLELAQRNLPEVKRRYGFSAYFIDTTFAAPPYECSSEEHPLTLSDDIRYKGELCDLSRTFFPIHGSEEGHEWAIPHSSYFEGIMGGVLSESPAGTRQIPLMDLVYHDCIALYTHQGVRAGPADARYIIRHLASGRMPIYSFGPHAYFEGEAIELAPAVPSVAKVEPGADPKHFRITYQWDVTGAVPATRCFVHFTDATGQIILQDDHDLPGPVEQWRPSQPVDAEPPQGGLPLPATQWQPGQPVIDGPRDVEIPEGLTGGFDVRIGLLAGERRLRLPAADDGALRVIVGQLHISEKGIRFTPPGARGIAADPTCFARADGGWGQALGPTDRFIKNTYEFMSPVNEITFTMRIVDHAFLDPHGRVERTAFADPRKPSRKLSVVTNAGSEVFRTDDAVLPPFGFVVGSPEFVAFHALQYQGVTYEPSALFCARLVTGTALGAPGSTVRIYHGFGPDTLRLPTRAATALVGEQRVKARKGLVEVQVPDEALVRFR